MDTFTAINTRRAVKHYDPKHKMSKDEFNQLLELGIQSPTAFNIQNWRFLNVTDKDLRKQIRTVAWDQSQITDASLLLVLCADLKAWDKNPKRYWKNAPDEVNEFMVPAIKQYYDNEDEVQRDEAMRSCGIVAQTLMLSAKAMGYDSCPMDGFDYDAVGKLINLPEDHIISMIVVVGKGIANPWAKPGQLPVTELTIENSF